MTAAWHHLFEGAGGYTTGLNISDDGLTKVCSIDVFGACLFDEPTQKWQQICTLPILGSGAALGYGVVDIRVAPSDKTRIYMWRGADGMWSSSDRGLTWTHQTNFPTTFTEPNGTDRLTKPRMAIDPINPDVIVVGHPTSGILRSVDGGANWTSPTGVASGAPYQVCFKRGGTSSGSPLRTDVCYVMSQGNGVYATSTAAGNYSLAAAGGPTSTTDGTMASTWGGVLFIGDDGLGHLWRLRSGTWATVGSQGIRAVAPDPNNVSRLVVTTQAGRLLVSLNCDIATAASVTFSAAVDGTITATGDVKWIDFVGWGGTPFYSVSEGALDINGKLWMGVGVGVLTTTPSNAGGTAFVWQSQSADIESLTGNGIVSPSWNTRHPIIFNWDRMMFYSNNQDAYPTSYQTDNGFGATWSMDYSHASDQIVGHLTYFEGSFGSDRSGISTDSGLTYTPFSSRVFEQAAVTNGTTSTSQKILHYATTPTLVAIGCSMFSSGGQLLGLVQAFTGTTITLDRNSPVSIANGDTTYVGGFNGGTISISTANNIIATGHRDAAPRVTLDGGASWQFGAMPTSSLVMGTGDTHGTTTIDNVNFNTQNHLASGDVIQIISSLVDFQNVTVTATPTSSSITVTPATNASETTIGLQSFTCFGDANFTRHNPICAHSSIALKHYFYDWQRGSFYVTLDGGLTWAKKSGATNLTASPYFQQHGGHVVSVPGNTNDIFMNFGSNRLVKSTDDGATWTAVANITSINWVALGKANPSGSGYPAVAFVGTLSGVVGAYQSDDGGTTWAALGPTGQQPLGSLDFPQGMSGDWGEYGRWYVVYSGSGPVYFGDNSVSGPTVIGFSVIHGHARRHTKMIGY